MQPDKLNRGSDNLPGPLVVVLVVETVNTLRMIDEGQGDVLGQCFGHKAIDRIKLPLKCLFPFGSRKENYEEKHYNNDVPVCGGGAFYRAG